VSTYKYDEGSGYYYDPNSTLYYDANSQYYFNSVLNKYMYWSGEHHTFLPAPDNGQQSGRKDEKEEKVKTAKKIAKDMEKWAKSLNQKKERGNVTAAGTHGETLGQSSAYSGAEDVAFSVLSGATDGRNSRNSGGGEGGGLMELVGYASEEEDEQSLAEAELALVEWPTLACLLCQRQFPSKEKLQK